MELILFTCQTNRIPIIHHKLFTGFAAHIHTLATWFKACLYSVITTVLTENRLVSYPKADQQKSHPVTDSAPNQGISGWHMLLSVRFTRGFPWAYHQWQILNENPSQKWKKKKKTGKSQSHFWKEGLLFLEGYFQKFMGINIKKKTMHESHNFWHLHEHIPHFCELSEVSSSNGHCTG